MAKLWVIEFLCEGEQGEWFYIAPTRKMALKYGQTLTDTGLERVSGELRQGQWKLEPTEDFYWGA